MVREGNAEFYNWLLKYKLDIFIVFSLMLISGSLAFYVAHQLDPILRNPYAGFDIWFQGDVPRVYINEISRTSDHRRSNVHPLVPLISYSAVTFLQSVLVLSPATAAMLFHSVVAALWIAALYCVLRLVGCKRFDASLFSIFASTSAAAFFWLVVPETYALGSLSILLVLGTLVWSERRSLSSSWDIWISAASLSITVTNWMVALVAATIKYPWQRSVQVSGMAFLLVATLALVQKQVFPLSRLFFVPSLGEAQFLLLPQSGGPLKVIQSFFIHTVVMPKLQISCPTCSDRAIQNRPLAEAKQPSSLWCFNQVSMTTQFSAPGSGSFWGFLAMCLWLLLLAMGMWVIITLPTQRASRLGIGATLAGQLLLHVVYGQETFLYSLHFLPLLILFVSLVSLSRLRMLGLVLTFLLSILLVRNNVTQFAEAKTRVAEYSLVWQQALQSKEQCPAALQDWAQMDVPHDRNAARILNSFSLSELIR